MKELEENCWNSTQKVSHSTIAIKILQNTMTLLVWKFPTKTILWFSFYTSQIFVQTRLPNSISFLSLVTSIKPDDTSLMQTLDTACKRNDTFCQQIPVTKLHQPDSTNFE